MKRRGLSASRSYATLSQNEKRCHDDQFSLFMVLCSYFCSIFSHQVSAIGLSLGFVNGLGNRIIGSNDILSVSVIDSVERIDEILDTI